MAEQSSALVELLWSDGTQAGWYWLPPP